MSQSATHEPNAHTSGLGISALILGILAIPIAWVPFVSKLAFLLALVGLVLGIIAILDIRKGKASGQGLTVAAIVLSLAGLGFASYTQYQVYQAVNSTKNMFNKVLDSATDAADVASAYSDALDSVAGSDDVASVSSGTADSTDAASSDQGVNPTQGLGIGQAVTLDSGLVISVDAVETRQDTFGTSYLFATVTYNNTGNKPADFSIFDWRQVGPTGVVEGTEYGFFDDALIESGTLQPGGTMSGGVLTKTDAVSLNYRSNLLIDKDTAIWKLQ